MARQVILQTNRFVCSKGIIDKLFCFAKDNENMDRKQFKDAWSKWIDENHNLIKEEINNLTNSGFKGDVINKLYKSARYYYRNKKEVEQEEKEEKPRKKYETVSKEIIEQMDMHINNQINSNIDVDNMSNTKISLIRPADSFNNYLKQYRTELIKELQSNGNQINKEDCENLISKYKKIYKNRFYTIRVKLNTI